MPRAAESESPATVASFAGLLAALTAPQKPPVSSWNEDGLADDIATISYERALKKHTCYASQEPGAGEAAPALLHDCDTASIRYPGRQAVQGPDASDSPGSSASCDKPLKRASITIRLTEAECAQLRHRASEAGLTVSAYLRSCTLEVESLRAQVKETLAQMRNAPSVRASAIPKAHPWRRFWSFAARHQTAVSASAR